MSSRAEPPDRRSRRGQDPSPPARHSERVDLLAPADVARLGGLELTTAGVVDGFLAGLHRSPRRGFAVEFAEHRQYQPGDEPRHIDWKLLARTDRLHVKQFEEDTNLRAMLVVDASASMGWRGASDRLTKLDYATRLTAALALVLLRQRDATGLITFDAAVRDVIPPRARRGHWHLLAATLQRLTVGSTTAPSGALQQVVAALRHRGLVIFCSDLLVDPELTLKALRFLRYRGHQVVVLHLADPAELELDPGDEMRFHDPESGHAVTVAPSDWAGAYRAAVRRAVSEWGTACRAAGMQYAMVPTTTPFGVALGQALRPR